METVCTISFNALDIKEARRQEAILREYLLRVCDEVSMTRIGSSPYSLFSIVPRGFPFRRFIRMLNDEDIAQQDSHSWKFRMTDNIKRLLNQATLLFNGSGRFFYGFMDPKFTRHGSEVADIISSEKLVNLYIPDDDKAQLSALGLYLDSPEII